MFSGFSISSIFSIQHKHAAQSFQHLVEFFKHSAKFRPSFYFKTRSLVFQILCRAFEAWREKQKLGWEFEKFDRVFTARPPVCIIARSMLSQPVEAVVQRCSVKVSLLKKRLWRKCFPGNFAKFLRALFFWNTSGGCFWCSHGTSDFSLSLSLL